MRLSQFLVTSEPFLDEASGQYKRIIFATRTGSLLALDEGSWREIERGTFTRLASGTLDQLIQVKVLVPEAHDELAEILNENNIAAEDQNQLYIVIQPTAYCQLGCDYCGQSHTNASLSSENQDRLVERARAQMQARRYQMLSIAWFGAEPLAGISVIRSLTPRLRAVSEAHHCDFGAKMVTNGLALTHGVATEIVAEHGVNQIEITLDGASGFHDARRHGKNGAPTFNKIFANLVDLALRRDLQVQVNVRCNVDRRNADGVSPLLQALADAGLQERITFYTASVYSWGNDAYKLSLPPEEYARYEVAWLAEMLLLGFAPSLVPNRKRVVCLATLPRGELVDAYGNLFNCTEVSYVPAYGVPNRYSLGTLKDGVAAERRELLRDFNSRVARGEYPCLSCRLLPVCGGACPKKWLEGFEPCPSAKRNIKERLLLFYAQSRTHAQARTRDGTAQSEHVTQTADAPTFSEHRNSLSLGTGHTSNTLIHIQQSAAPVERRPLAAEG
jgi:uncharacterized protein